MRHDAVARVVVRMLKDRAPDSVRPMLAQDYGSELVKVQSGRSSQTYPDRPHTGEGSYRTRSVQRNRDHATPHRSDPPGSGSYHVCQTHVHLSRSEPVQVRRITMPYDPSTLS